MPLGQGKGILLCGVQRSGTNMMMRVLDRMLVTEVYNEYDELAFQLYSLRDLETIKSLHSKSRAAFFGLKILQELDRVGEIAEIFPSVAVIWQYRDYRDVVNSHMVSWPGFRECIDEMASDRAAGAWRGKGITDEHYRLLQEYYRPDLSDGSCVALFWYLRNTLLFTQKLDHSPRTVMVPYEWLVASPAEALKAVCAQIGLPYDPRIHSFVHSRSISKRTPPHIDPAVEQLCDEMTRKLDETAKKHFPYFPIDQYRRPYSPI